MKKFSLSFAFSQGFSQIAKTAVMSIATVLVLAGCLLVLGTVGLLQFNVDENLTDLSSEGEVVVFMQSDCTETEIGQMNILLDNYRKEGLLEKFTYVSKEDALRSEMIKFEDYPQLFQSIQSGENPYRASFAISVGEDGDIPRLLERLQGVTLSRADDSGQVQPFKPVANLVSHADAIETVKELMSGIRTAALVVLAILLAVGLFVLMNTIRLAIFSRRQELAVMRYVGATRSFITAPFLMQGIVLGFFSAAVAFFLQWFFYSKITAYLAQQYDLLTLLSFDSVWYYLLAAFLFAGLLVGTVGGVLSTGRYLREKD
ncbi:MAG: permease-like cell division protein FtsX [Clostridia bacterium]|nr:permease-like cell division protein FtsX [Clostridia bacterium]